MSKGSLLGHAARNKLDEMVSIRFERRNFTRQAYHTDVVSVQQNLGHFRRRASVVTSLGSDFDKMEGIELVDWRTIQ